MPSRAAPRTGVLVLGDGGWGTALALVLAAMGRAASVWGHEARYTAEVERRRENPRFLAGVAIPPGVRFGSDLEELAAAAGGFAAMLSVVPTQFLRPVLERLREPLGALLPPDALVVSCSKGFERGSLALPSAVLREFLPAARIVVLSGPSHAEEVSRRLPTAVVVAARRTEEARAARDLVTAPFLRAYTSTDPLGVEIGGAAKNVVALAAGISDGLGLGDNARAGLICRGAREITRLGTALGARQETFAGLAGMGDLIATCTSTHSRNHTVGYRLARGETLDAVLASMDAVAEGVETTRCVRELARAKGIELPIADAVHAILSGAVSPRQAVESLMQREPKDEF